MICVNGYLLAMGGIILFCPLGAYWLCTLLDMLLLFWHITTNEFGA
jgi:hypothetical protein